MPSIFLTGFPGFLGTSLVQRLLARHDADTTIVCLIQNQFRLLAEERAAVLQQVEGTGARLRLVEGDITLPGLGLGDEATRLKQEVREVFHLAAVYDLAVPRDLALRVNVEGTRNVLRFATDCPHLDRLHYVSTCYVSGRYDGVFTEDQLDEGQAFNNHYEETKFLAERDVQQAMNDGLPASIYRPAIVVGDSRTGATQKYDGPYMFIRWLLRWSRIAPMIVPGALHRHTTNVVPRDFVVDALAYLSGLESSKGKVYQLCDPRPLTIAEAFDLLARVTGRRLLRVPAPLPLVKYVLRLFPALQRWTGFLPEALDYLLHPTHYTAENTLDDLEGSGIACPPFAAYAPHLVAFARTHPEVPSHGLA